jgi:SAM-dependent methyltransferase
MHCCICGHDGTMSYDFPDVRLRKAHGIGLLRETLRCKSCGGTMRDRQVAYGLLQAIAERSGTPAPDLHSLRHRQDGFLRILDTDAFSSINRTLRGMTGYVWSQYQSGRPNGSALADGSINVNLESMPFASDSFDVILTSDVMEHVFNDGLAHREIFRCLAPRGRYIFTVPFDPCIVAHRKLTQPTGQGRSHFLLEEHIHGDPHARTGIIAHRIYGRQLLDDMHALGYRISFLNVERSDIGIFGGDLFIATKES